jgi:hypothetical protein
VITRQRRVDADPISPLRVDVWEHEKRHAAQYAWCGGLPFLAAYAAAAGYSWAVSGDPASYNVFETRANLAAGGYTQAVRRPAVQTVSSRLRRQG